MGRPGTFTSKSGAAATKRRTTGKGKDKNKSRKTPSKAAAEEAAAERERARANGKRGREMQLAGRVADNAPTRADRKMVVEAVQPREAWENAMDLMRQRESGWVHARLVDGKMVGLLAAGAAVDQARNNGSTPLYIAAKGGHEAVVKRLLAAGAAVDRARSDGSTPLRIACQKGHEVVAALLFGVFMGRTAPTT